jgi:hypothetical protein
MPYYIHLILDGANGPTHVKETKIDGLIYFRSENYSVGSAPAFEIEFDLALINNFDIGASTARKAGTETTFESSSPPGKSYHEVKIKLKNSGHPSDGYKYSVTMEYPAGSGTMIKWDPRVVPH